jgi:hypothetical protein
MKDFLPVYITGWQHSGERGVNALNNQPLPVNVMNK